MNTLVNPPSIDELGAPAPSTILMAPSESLTLKQAFEEIITEDPRCVGLSRYIANVRIFWSYAIPTACAGHGFIFFNPTFYDKIPAQTRITVCVHEIWHLILKHLDRSVGCDPYIHNEAADHVINLGCEQDGFTFDGTNPYKDSIYQGMSTEQVYNVIYKAKKDQPRTQGTGASGSPHIPKELIEDLIEQIVQEEGKTLEEQKQKAEKDIDDQKGAGSSTGSQGIKLELTNTKVMILGATYHDIFEDYLIDPLSGGNRTYMRPNRRQHGMKNQVLKLPGRLPKRGHINRLTHLVYALDVSGSITPTQKQQFHDSVRTLKDLLNPSKLTVLFFDTRIKLEKTFTDKEQYGNIHVQAGGGTSLVDVYKRTKELDPEALVIFTDLEVNIPPKPTWDCIWLVPASHHKIPQDIYGKVYLIPQHSK